MKHDETAGKLLVDLEQYIGGTCYNPRSYNGWTGETGCYFSYPVHFYKDADSCSWYEYALSMHYKFGANHLRVGKSILNLLEHLEDRYGIDISSLEAEYQAKEAKRLKELKEDERFYDKVRVAFSENGYEPLQSGGALMIFVPSSDPYLSKIPHNAVIAYCTRTPEEVTSSWLKDLIAEPSNWDEDIAEYDDGLTEPTQLWCITTDIISEEALQFAQANNIHVATNLEAEFASI